MEKPCLHTWGSTRLAPGWGYETRDPPVPGPLCSRKEDHSPLEHHYWDFASGFHLKASSCTRPTCKQRTHLRLDSAHAVHVHVCPWEGWPAQFKHKQPSPHCDLRRLKLKMKNVTKSLCKEAHQPVPHFMASALYPLSLARTGL